MSMDIQAGAGGVDPGAELAQLAGGRTAHSGTLPSRRGKGQATKTAHPTARDGGSAGHMEVDAEAAAADSNG